MESVGFRVKSTRRASHRKPSTPTPVLTHARPPWAVPAFVAALTCIAFFPVLGNDFVNWDDDKNFIENPFYRGLAWNQLRWMFTTFHMGHYQPLSWVSFGFDYLLWGMNARGYHLTSLVLHAVNGVLFYFVSRKLLSAALSTSGRDDWRLVLSSAFSALVFAIHPLRVESVAWVTERRDVLSGLFYLLTIYCYLQAAEPQLTNARQRWLGVALVAYTLSLLSKGMAMTLPAVLLLLDVYPLGRLQGRISTWLTPAARVVLIEKLPFLLLAAIFAGIAALAQHTTDALKTVQQYDLVSRLLQMFFGFGFYLWKTLIPVRLSPIYELPVNFDPWAWLFFLSAAAAIFISLVLYSLRRRWPAPLACWIYYIIVLAPVSGLAQSGPQLVADRYSYLACMSWPLLIGGGLYHSWPFREATPNQRRFPIPFVLAGGLVFTLALMTWSQTGVWRSGKTLWRHAISSTPYSSIAYYNLARALEREDSVDEAVDLYRQAVSINPEYARAHINLAGLLIRQGRDEEAIAHYRSALQSRPDHAGAHNNLGVLLEKRGDTDSALVEFQKAVLIDPTIDQAYFNMGKVFAQQGDLAKAAEHYQEAVRLNPNEAEYQIGLAMVLARQGELDLATSHLFTAVRLQPNHGYAHVLLARSLVAQGKKSEAEKYFQQGLTIMKSHNQIPPSGLEFRESPSR
jgi:tetratricopeptide (TPR) repeat protein